MASTIAAAIRTSVVFNLLLAVAMFLIMPGSASAKLVLYEHKHYHGHKVHFTQSVSYLHHFNDKASAVQVSPGEIWILYEHTHFRGRSLVVHKNIPSLGHFHFNDKVSSAKLIAAQCYLYH